MKESCQKILNELLTTGGLIITQRQVGKTQALLHILNRNKNAVIITFDNKSRNFLIQKYQKMFTPTVEIKNRIFSQFDNIELIKNPEKNLYIDDYFFHKSPPKVFAGAVSTMLFPVQIKKLKSHNTKMKNILTDSEYELEYGLFIKEK